MHADLADKRAALDARYADQLAELEKAKAAHEQNLEAARRELEAERAKMKSKMANFYASWELRHEGPRCPRPEAA